MGWKFGRRSAAPASVVLAVSVLASLATAVGAPQGAAAAAAAPQAVAAAAPTSRIIDVGTPVHIEIITAASRSIVTSLQSPSTAEPLYVPAGLITDTSWTTEAATVPDRTTDPRSNRVTPRTATMVDAAIDHGVARQSSTTCVAGRSANPASDHPGGRGCDLMFDPSSAAGVAAGWRAANWLVANQAALGVKYVIWQGMIWNARSRPGPWTTYNSTAYGCPNPANLTGCHYDHVHVSMY